MTPELLFQPLANSFLLSAGTAVVNVLAAVLAAYPLSRYQSRFNRPFMYTVLFGTSLPVTAIMVPVYGLFVQLQFLDSMAATIFFMATTTLPMAIWMTKNFMDSVPLELEEAAWVDGGASTMAALRSIVLPLMRQGLGVVFIFVFIQAWGGTSSSPSSCCCPQASNQPPFPSSASLASTALSLTASWPRSPSCIRSLCWCSMRWYRVAWEIRLPCLAL